MRSTTSDSDTVGGDSEREGALLDLPPHYSRLAMSVPEDQLAALRALLSYCSLLTYENAFIETGCVSPAGYLPASQPDSAYALSPV